MAKQSAKKEAQDKINLKPSEYKFTREDVKKGQAKAAENRRRRKLMREAVTEILSMPLTDREIDDIEAIKSLAGVNGANVTALDAMIYQLTAKAIKKGDVKSIELLWKITGQDKDRDDDDTDAVKKFLESMVK